MGIKFLEKIYELFTAVTFFDRTYHLSGYQVKPDRPGLIATGVKGIFGPGASMESIAACVAELL